MKDPTPAWQASHNVPSTLDVFATHFPRFPVLPGVLLLQRLSDLAIERLHQRTGRQWRLSRYERIKFRRFVRPGDRMQLTVQPREVDGHEATVRATVHVDGGLVATIGGMTLVPEPPR